MKHILTAILIFIVAASYGQMIDFKGTKVTLTTTGSSGAATYNNGTATLNIPQYSGGVGGLNNVYAPLIKSGDTISRRYNILHYGADTAKRVYDFATTNTSTTVTSATASFTSNDVGKTILINGAGSAGGVLRTTISSVTNSTTIVVANAASATTSGDTTIYGKDNTTPLQNAITDCKNGGGGTIFIPVGTYLFSSPLIAASNAQITIPVDSGGTSTVKVVISIEGEAVYGGSASGYLTGFPGAVQTRGTILYSTISGSGYMPAFIGSADTTTRNRNDVSISNLGFMVYTNHGASAVSVTPINARMFQKINVRRCTISPDIEVIRTVSPASSEVAGIIAGGVNDNGENMIEENEIAGFKYDLVLNEHTVLNGNLIWGAIYGIALPFSGHPISGNSQIFACAHEIYSPSTTIFGEAAGESHINLLIESEFDNNGSIPAGIWYTAVDHINDSSNHLTGAVRFNNVANGSISNSSIIVYGSDSSKFSWSTYTMPYAFLNKPNQLFAVPLRVNAGTNDDVRIFYSSSDSASLGKRINTGGIFTTGDLNLYNNSHSTVFYNNNSTGDFKWGTNTSSPQMYLSSAGNLGLAGVTSPAMALDATGYNATNSIGRFGDIELSSVALGDNSWSSNTYWNGSVYKLRKAGQSIIVNLTNNNYRISTIPYNTANATVTPTQRFYIDSTGSVGIGGTQTNNSLTGSNMTVLGTGNVGINTTSPAQKLQVKGQVQIDTLATGTAGTDNFLVHTSGLVKQIAASSYERSFTTSANQVLYADGSNNIVTTSKLTYDGNTFNVGGATSNAHTISIQSYDNSVPVVFGRMTSGGTLQYGDVTNAGGMSLYEFWLAGSEWARWNGSSFLIGTTSGTTYKLDVNGTINSGSTLHLNSTPSTNSEATEAVMMRNTSSGNVEQRKIAVGQTTLVSGTKAVTVTGIGTGSIAIVTLVTPSGTSLTTTYQAVCTSNTLTIQANVAAGTINTADASTLNYEVWF